MKKIILSSILILLSIVSMYILSSDAYSQKAATRTAVKTDSSKNDSNLIVYYFHTNNGFFVGVS